MIRPKRRRGRWMSPSTPARFRASVRGRGPSLDVPVLGHIENRIILLNVFDRINLIRPATGTGVFQSAYGPRVTVYDALTIPLLISSPGV